MASLPIEAANDEPPLAAGGLMLKDILSGKNLAELLEESKLNEIGQTVIRDVEIDDSSRGEWLDRNEKNIDTAMQVREDKVFPWPGCSNAVSSILTVASIQFNAEAYPIICDGSNLVKGRVLGPDPDGKKRERAERIGQHMTWQLLYRMMGWEEGMDKLLFCLPIVANVFKKCYYSAIENANCSEMVTAKDFIINYWAKSIETAPRYTQILHYYPYEVKEFVSAGLWLDVPLDDEDIGEDEQALGEYYEQHRCLDLDEDGYPEHYVVTCTKQGEVARIVPCFGIEDITAQILDPHGRVVKTAKVSKIFETLQDPNDPHWALVGEIVKIERRQYFTKYGFIPAPDGSFYDIGFGDLLENTTGLIDTLQNQMIDAATLANSQGGFLGSGVTVRGGNFSFRSVGEWKRVDVTGGNLRDNILPLQLPGPSPVSMTLLEMLFSQAKDIASSQDVVSGKAPPNQPATTTLALIEQAGMVKKGVLKRIWRSFGQELRILRRLNRDYLDEEEYFQLNDPKPEMGPDGQPITGQDGKPQMTAVAKIGRDDYADDDLDVIPVADPNQISNAHKVARTQAMHEMFNGDPMINQKKLRQEELEALGATDIKEWLDVPQPPPPPEVLLGMAKEENAKAANAIKADEARTKLIEARAGAVQKFADAALKFAEAGLLPDAAMVAQEAMNIIGEEENEPANGPGGVSGLEGQPPDQGLPPVPQGTPGGADGGMGGGPAGEPPAGAPGPGSFAGAPGGAGV